MKYRVSELEGALLDAAVAMAEGDGPREEGPLPYSTWSLCGPIIERELIQVAPSLDGVRWCANINFGPPSFGSTPIVAALRCYVKSKFADEVVLAGDGKENQ